jgi:hypothetical protein
MRKTLTIPIYDCECTLVVTKKYKEAVVEAGYHQAVCPTGAITLSYPDSPMHYVMIFHKEAISPGHIAHEALHLVHKIMLDVDIGLSLKDDEAQAYLLGFIVDLIHQAIQKT